MNSGHVALIISILSLAVAALAYRKAGGQTDTRGLRLELEALRNWQKEAVARAQQCLSAAYEKSDRRLQSAAVHLRVLKGQAIEGLERQLGVAQEQLDTLARRVEEAARTCREAAVTVAQSLEEAIALRVRRLEARVHLLQAKSKASRAIVEANKKNFPRAEGLLQEATELLADARATLGEDRAYEEQMTAVRLALHLATGAIRAETEDFLQKLQQVVNATDRLVDSLTSDEARESGAASNPSRQPDRGGARSSAQNSKATHNKPSIIREL